MVKYEKERERAKTLKRKETPFSLEVCALFQNRTVSEKCQRTTNSDVEKNEPPLKITRKKNKRKTNK